MNKQIIHEKQDLTYLSWAKIRNSSGTAGSFLKAYSELGGEKTYYKLSDYDRMEGIVGHECFNEIIVDRLLDILGIEHLRYQLIHADIMVGDMNYDTYLCASTDFKKSGESKIALEGYYEAEKIKEESPLAFCIRQGWEEGGSIMRIFAIKSESDKKDLAYLLYYEKEKRFYIELPEEADPWETPLLLASFLKRGEKTVNSY